MFEINSPEFWVAIAFLAFVGVTVLESCRLIF